LASAARRRSICAGSVIGFRVRFGLASCRRSRIWPQPHPRNWPPACLSILPSPARTRTGC